MNEIDPGDKKPEIGKWYTRCCQRDLEQITSQETVDDIVTSREDKESIGVYDTRKEALDTTSVRNA